MGELTEGHTVKGYDVDLAGLRLKLLEMGGLVLEQVQSAVTALAKTDEGAARAVLEREEEVNRYDLAIDDDSITLIARRQPMGSDLRAIISIARVITDLERVGDEAKKIAHIVLSAKALDMRSARLTAQLTRDARHMARFACGMLRDALDAFDRMEATRAVEVARRDAELNAEFQGAVRRLVTRVMEDPRRLASVLDAMTVLKALEHVGDHAKNIARHVLYLVEGRDVRHEDTAVLMAIEPEKPDRQHGVGG
ncbi:MAG TPA: phosphate signaling complex protein PhoU [Steroidobacteraceae bacterium]|nr:phosphate signaling complex protein PhoU [Steroidobacteraceae bacterium]